MYFKINLYRYLHFKEQGEGNIIYKLLLSTDKVAFLFAKLHSLSTFIKVY